MPTLGQNGQFKFIDTPESFATPTLPSHAATMLREDSHDLLWYNDIVERHNTEDYHKKLYAFSREFVMLVAKTLIISQH